MPRTLRGDPNKLELKRQLRVAMTTAERMLWSKLRAKQFLGLKFRRQHGIGPFVVDFFCPEKRLVVEVDGDVHDEINQIAHDRAREEYLRCLSLDVVRYQNNAVLNHLNSVLTHLANLVCDSETIVEKIR
ncbi:MAG TPA: endonuclease domain-containing protein [bacterium]|nr:endonuclease domain-containing protein [bacterium]